MVVNRRYPVGIQTFSEIIRGGYVYVDKTDLVWQLTNYAKYIFLSRPRRFGKSLLSSTLESYFLGERDLFKGLKISEVDSNWTQYPVIRMDLSIAKGQGSSEDLQSRLMLLLDRYAEQYGKKNEETTPGRLLDGIINRAYEKHNRQVVIIVDEYDAPLLEVLHEEQNLSVMRSVMQEFYQPLKANERYIKFCFITGITKFSQLSIFSTINNLTNVSTVSRFSSICGITESELTTVFSEDIKQLAVEYSCSAEEMHSKLKLMYDGYHFSEKSEDLYNPFSLLTTFRHLKLGNYWFETGTPTYLVRQMKHFRTDITSVDDIEVPSTAFDRSTEGMSDALPLLYQSGYLTIKGYDQESNIYTLSIPNQEVRTGYIEGLLPEYIGLQSHDVQTGFALKFWRALKQNDIEQALREMQSYLAGIPYVEGFKQKLQDAANAEGFYEYTLYLIFSMLNVYVRTQIKCAGGRIDMVVYMPDVTYIFELKTKGTAEEALQQIIDKGYAMPYITDNRKVVKVGLKFNINTRILEEWVVD